jgi:hypothetical protein
MSTQEQPDFYQASYLEDSEGISYSHLVVASKITAAIVETFEVDQGLVRTIPHNEDGKTKAAVVYVGDGLHKGDLGTIHHPYNDDEFMLEVREGQKSIDVDSRADMVFPLFETMVRILQAEAMLDKMDYCPDLLAKAHSNEMTRPGTLLTGHNIRGDEEGEEDDQVAYVHLGVVVAAGEAVRRRIKPHDMKKLAPRVGFRPGVVIRDALVDQYMELNPTEDLTL